MRDRGGARGREGEREREGRVRERGGAREGERESWAVETNFLQFFCGM